MTLFVLHGMALGMKLAGVADVAGMFVAGSLLDRKSYRPKYF